MRHNRKSDNARLGSEGLRTALRGTCRKCTLHSHNSQEADPSTGVGVLECILDRFLVLPAIVLFQEAYTIVEWAVFQEVRTIEVRYLVLPAIVLFQEAYTIVERAVFQEVRTDQVVLVLVALVDPDSSF